MLSYVIIPFLIHMIIYWSSCYYFYLLDLKYLDITNLNWKKYNQAIRTSLCNQCFISLPTIYLLRGFLQNLIETSYTDTLFISIIKIFFIINLSNIFFYLFHRLLHHEKIYKYIHYKHHEFRDPIAVSAFYAHPIEHLFSNTLSFIVPIMLIGTNYWIMIILLVLATINSVLAHVKYIFVKNDHLLHHKLYKYNFGFGGYIDRIFNTNSPTINIPKSS